MGPFDEWLTKVKARMGPSFGGQKILYFDFGAQQLAMYLNSRPPAIAFELGDDRFTTDTGARRGANSVEADPLYIADTTVTVHVLGQDADETHELRRAMIAALWDIGHQSYRLSVGTWNTGNVQSNGTAYLFPVMLRIPITRDPEGKAVITDFTPNDFDIQQPGDETS